MKTTIHWILGVLTQLQNQWVILEIPDIGDISIIELKLLFFEWWVYRHNQKHATETPTSCDTTTSHFPNDQAKAIDVSHYVGLEMVFIQAFIEHFWSHVAFGAHPSIQRHINFICVTEAEDRKRPGWEKRKSFLLYFHCIVWQSEFVSLSLCIRVCVLYTQLNKIYLVSLHFLISNPWG